MIISEKSPAKPAFISEFLQAKIQKIRLLTVALCEPLILEDYLVQPEENTSSPKWHLAHTTWFFEAFILKIFSKNYQWYNEHFSFLFNSYYDGAGKHSLQAHRSKYSRPSLQDVFDYRHSITTLLLDPEAFSKSDEAEILQLIELGLNHEQQHQELLLTDIKRIFHFNPSAPAYRSSPIKIPATGMLSNQWFGVEGGWYELGARKNSFCFDNELPRHQEYVFPFKLSGQVVSNAQYLAFMADNGYGRPELWLSEGWELKKEKDWVSPLYWEKNGSEWMEFTLNGLLPLNLYAPACHVSYYEADAYARWAGKRLPTEAEWEAAAIFFDSEKDTGHFLETSFFHPAYFSFGKINKPSQMLGNVWEWTSSAYLPYRGFRPLPGTVGEYNGKFMVNQMVLRGGSCVTPASHMRTSYRNFLPAHARWQFSSIRLAEDDKVA